MRLPPVGSPNFGPNSVGPPAAPGYLRSITRHGVARGAPIPAGVVSAHAPPWEQLPAPSEHPGQVMRVHPHGHDPRSHEVHSSTGDFSPDPFYEHFGWDANAELRIYGGKKPVYNPRPLVELGLPFYDRGPIPPSRDFLGPTNLVQPKLYVYGDFRTAVATNRFNGNERTVWANRLNLDIDFAVTATERFHMFWGPLDERNVDFVGVVFDGDDTDYVDAWDGWDERTDALFFEGDLGYIVGGLTGIEAPYDLPFTVGLIPLLFQNGIWVEDAFVGAAATIPAQNSPGWDFSNFDTTVFIGFDEITNAGFGGENNAGSIVGFTTFIERRGGYIEAGYAFLDDSRNLGRSHHSFAASYTRRYLNLVSNSVRTIVNTGQDGPRDARSADGVLFLMENSFLTRLPYNVVPYANLFAGFGTPRPAARLTGPLRNTGINFETDFLTGYPFLDDTANDTYGGAVGIDLLGYDYRQQLLLELATVQVMSGSAVAGDQYAFGVRYQKALNNAWLVRADAMHGWLENADDIFGGRVELRRKF
ncbi:MAG: hypothetical protein AAGA92_07155 [Planctomycetota bacterium]